MDIMLQRILSLIPKKENGDFEHGALKDFAQSIGLKSGNLISDWKMGRSKSYQGYIYEIAAKYSVSVEWLRGETDEKKPTPEKSELSEELRELIRRYDKASPVLRAAALAVLRSGESAATTLDDGREEK